MYTNTAICESDTLDTLTKGHGHQSTNKEEVINTKEIDCLSRHAEISFQFKIKALEYIGSFCQYTIQEL